MRLTEFGDRMKRRTSSELSHASYDCRNVIPSKRCVSSRDIGWKSLLVDVHSDLKWHSAYSGVITPDPRIGVSLSGNYITHYHSRGFWRNDIFQPGTTTVLRSEESRRFRFTPLAGGECEFALVYFPLDELASAADHFRRPGQSASVPIYNQAKTHDPTIYEVTRTLIRAMEAGAPDIYAQSVSAWLATHVVFTTGSSFSSDDNRRSGDLSDARLRRVIEYMSTHFGEQISLEQLAQEADVTKYHFTRLFRRKVGVSPIRCLSQIRLEAARDLLITTDLRIRDIARVCGFTAPSHFSTAFAARYGKTPEKFREAHA